MEITEVSYPRDSETRYVITVGDLVRTRALKIRYVVKRIWMRPERTLVMCQPIDQPHWGCHFAFDPEQLEPLPADGLEGAA